MSKKDLSRIYLIGFMGAGKSSTGKELAKMLRLNFLDLDEAIEDQSGENLHDIFIRSEEEFRRIEAATLRNLNFSNTVFALGGGTPCYHDNMDYLLENGIAVYLKVTAGELYRRLRKHKKVRPLIDGKDENELKTFIDDLLAKRKIVYEKADIIFDVEKESVEGLGTRIDQFR